MGKLGENIKRIRGEMGLSQRQFGELIGKSDSQIWSYENDRTDILASTLYKIAAVANVDFNNLMAGIIPEEEPEKEPDPEWDAEPLRRFLEKYYDPTVEVVVDTGVVTVKRGEYMTIFQKEEVPEENE